jgi:hypothetical protein
MARHVPYLSFLHVILGDEPVLAPEAQLYQRLLASDEREAKQVLEDYLKDKPLEDLFDSVLIPALSLAEQDRHHNELDEATGTFISRLAVNAQDAATDAVQDADEPAASGCFPLLPRDAAADRANYVVCVPVRDEADEIAGTMLPHLLERAGYRTHFLEIGSTAEMLAQVLQERPAIVCLSALPPFAVAHARRLYQAVRAQSPDQKIVISLWNFAGDPQQAASRITGTADGQVSKTLAHAMQQIKFLTGVVPQPAETPV